MFPVLSNRDLVHHIRVDVHLQQLNPLQTLTMLCPTGDASVRGTTLSSAVATRARSGGLAEPLELAR